MEIVEAIIGFADQLLNYWSAGIIIAVVVIWKGFLKQLNHDFIERIVTRFSKEIMARVSAIVFREKEQYRKLCRKLIRDYYIGGLKDYTPHKSIENVYINLKCGSVNSDNPIFSSLIVSDDELPIKNRKEFHSYINSSDNNVILLLGGAGSGKTTAVNHVLEKLISSSGSATPIPIIVREIERYADRLKSIDLLSLVKIYFEDRVCRGDDSFPVDWLNRQLESGNCLILVDGIDEIQSTENRRHILAWIKDEIRRNGENRFLLTSRPHGVGSLDLPAIDTQFICPLDDEDVRIFVTRWYKSLAESACKVACSNEHESIRSRRSNQSKMLLERIMKTSVLLELARKPMILTMMVVVHETGNTLPERRSSLFDRVVTVMLGDRDQARGLPNRIAPEHKLSLLSRLAFAMKRKGINRISKADITSFVEGQRNDFDREICVEDFLAEAVINSGLLVANQENTYTFCHSSFRDYLAAQYLRENQTKISVDYLYGLTKSLEWAEVLLLLAGQIDATSLLKRILDSGEKNNLEFLLALLDESHRIEVSVRKEAHAFIEKLIDQSDAASQFQIGRAFLRHRLKDIPGNKEKILDTKLISNIEYFYYLEKSFTNHSSMVPLGWGDGSYNPEMALFPVRGVTLSSSSGFCDWLTRTYGDGWRYRNPNKDDVDLLCAKMNPSLYYFWLEGVDSDDIRKVYGDKGAARLEHQIKEIFTNTLAKDLVVYSRLLFDVAGDFNVLRVAQHELFISRMKSQIKEIAAMPDAVLQRILLRCYLLGINVLRSLRSIKKYEATKEECFTQNVHAIYHRHDIGPILRATCEESADLLAKSLIDLLGNENILELYEAMDHHSVEYLEGNLELAGVNGDIDKVISRKLSNSFKVDDLNGKKITIRPFFWFYRLLALNSIFTEDCDDVNLTCLRFAKSAVYENSLNDEMINQIGLLLVKEAI